MTVALRTLKTGSAAMVRWAGHTRCLLPVQVYRVSAVSVNYNQYAVVDFRAKAQP